MHVWMYVHGTNVLVYYTTHACTYLVHMFSWILYHISCTLQQLYDLWKVCKMNSFKLTQESESTPSPRWMAMRPLEFNIVIKWLNQAKEIMLPLSMQDWYQLHLNHKILHDDPWSPTAQSSWYPIYMPKKHPELMSLPQLLICQVYEGTSFYNQYFIFNLIRSVQMQGRIIII